MQTFEEFLQERVQMMSGWPKASRNQLPSLNQLSAALRQVAADDPSFPNSPERDSYVNRKPYPRNID